MAGDWLDVPEVGRLRQAHEALAPACSGGEEQPEHRTGDPDPVNLAAPEHREKLIALFRWASEGRRWEEIRDDAVAMVLPPRKPPESR